MPAALGVTGISIFPIVFELIQSQTNPRPTRSGAIAAKVIFECRPKSCSKPLRNQCQKVWLADFLRLVDQFLDSPNHSRIGLFRIDPFQRAAISSSSTGLPGSIERCGIVAASYLRDSLHSNFGNDLALANEY